MGQPTTELHEGRVYPRVGSGELGRVGSDNLQILAGLVGSGPCSF